LPTSAIHLLCWQIHLAIQTIHQPSKSFSRQMNRMRELLNRMRKLLNRLIEQVSSLTRQVSLFKTRGMLLRLARFLQSSATVAPRRPVLVASSRLIMFTGPSNATAPMLSPGWAAMDKRAVKLSRSPDAHPCGIRSLSRDIPAFLQPNRVIGAKTCPSQRSARNYPAKMKDICCCSSCKCVE
jgi:hypothetical protein